MLLPRHSAKLSIPLLALPLSCTGDDKQDDDIGDDTGTETGGDGDGDGDGDGGPCTAPGTTVPEFEPFVPGDDVPLPTCSTGWGSDAPLQEAKWAVMMPQANPYYYYIPVVVKALPGGGALLVETTQLHWFDGQGQVTGEVSHGFSNVRPAAVHVRESDDHVFIAGGADTDIVIREFADGVMASELTVPTPGDNPRVAALFAFSPDEWLIAGDEFDPDEGNEAFFMRVDAQGNELLRKAPPATYSYYYSTYVRFGALDADDNLLFGSGSQLWIVDALDGSVLNPGLALGGLRGTSGSATGSGFAWASTVNQDGSISLINAFGVNQWTQTYDRAFTFDNFNDVAARPGGYVVGGADGIWWQPGQFQASTQPLVIAVDEQGNAEWLGRLAIPGDTRSVHAASDGSVVAAGNSRTGGESYYDVDAWIWVAAW